MIYVKYALAAIAVSVLPTPIGSAVVLSDALTTGPDGFPVPFVLVFVALFPPAFVYGVVTGIIYTLTLFTLGYLALSRKRKVLLLTFPVLNAVFFLLFVSVTKR